MKKVLYLSNIEVPYRIRFFNELAKFCQLTVLYERQKSDNRDDQWTKREQRNFCTKYLNGIHVRNENSFSLGILKHILGDYDVIIVGCYNSPVQAMAVLLMKLQKIPYYLNVDGEIFLGNSGIKNMLKRWVLGGAAGYLAAGEKAAESLRAIAPGEMITPYYFSSLSQEELENHGQNAEKSSRDGSVLVVGQYFDYKGMDVALEAAKMDSSISYQFVGMGSRTDLFRKNLRTEEIKNVELIPFLQKEDLEQRYKTCAMLVLPSRQECWGLVINEAASFGTPIVSTWGSGAAVEFLEKSYPRYLAQPDDAEDLLRCIHDLQKSDTKEEYSRFLIKKAEEYSIEKSVQYHVEACRL